MIEPIPSRSSFAVSASLDNFSYDQHQVLTDIRLEVLPGKTLSILGPSGCGKSTIIGILAGLLPKKSTDILIGNVSIFGQAPRTYRVERGLSVMFQDPTLLPHLTVQENVRLPLEVRPGQRDDERVNQILKLVGLEKFRSYLPKELSGGMKTRVALARSFVLDPKLLLMDEPFVGLDLGWKEDLYRTLSELRSHLGTTGIIVTHDLAEAVYNSDSVIVLSRDGRVLDEISIPGTFPRKFEFSESVSKYTDVLIRLAELLTSDRQ